LKNRRSTLANTNFRLFWIARMAAMLALTALVLTIGWQVYDLARQTMGIKGAALRLGLIGLVQFLPVLACTPVAGVIIDRVDRRSIARLALALQALGAAILTVTTATGMVSIGTLYLVAVMLGVAKAFFMPSISALVPNLVSREDLPRAIATSAVASRVGGILGPVVGGYAYAIAPAASFGISAGLLLLSVVCLTLVSQTGAQHERGTGHPMQMLREGFAYVLGNRLLLGTISLDLFAVLLGGATALLPVFARDILHVGPQGLGYLRSAPAVGALATAVWFSWRPTGYRMARKMLVAVGIFGAATIGFGLSASMPLSLAFLAILGGADMVSVVTRQSLVQLHTPDAMRGRVGAISTLAISSSNELGEAESGLVAALIGPVAAVVAGGMGALGITGLWLRLFPELARADQLECPPSH
jgi:MFS family permease